MSEVPRSLRILVVEDEMLVSMFLVDVLEDLGHKVIGSADNPAAALAIAARETADLALVDISLRDADRDGIDTALALRDLHNVPTVFMSGATEYAHSERASRAQPLAHLIKPYTQLEIEQTLRIAVPLLKP